MPKYDSFENSSIKGSLNKVTFKVILVPRIHHKFGHEMGPLKSAILMKVPPQIYVKNTSFRGPFQGALPRFFLRQYHTFVEKGSVRGPNWVLPRDPRFEPEITQI